MADLVFNPDRTLWESGRAVATSDGLVLDRCQCLVNLTWHIIREGIPDARLVYLSGLRRR